MSVIICSNNVNGIRDFVKRQKIFNHFKNKSVDILCLQETYSNSSDEKFWESEWGNQILVSHGTNNSKGVCILFRKNFEYQINNVIKDLDGHYIICVMKINERNIVLTNVYGPKTDTPQFYEIVFD